MITLCSFRRAEWRKPSEYDSFGFSVFGFQRSGYRGSNSRRQSDGCTVDLSLSRQDSAFCNCACDCPLSPTGERARVRGLCFCDCVLMRCLPPKPPHPAYRPPSLPRGRRDGGCRQKAISGFTPTARLNSSNPPNATHFHRQFAKLFGIIHRSAELAADTDLQTDDLFIRLALARHRVEPETEHVEPSLELRPLMASFPVNSSHHSNKKVLAAIFNDRLNPLKHPIQRPECVINAFKNYRVSHGKFQVPSAERRVYGTPVAPPTGRCVLQLSPLPHGGEG